MTNRLETATALARAAGKNVGGNVRELGVVSLQPAPPARAEAAEQRAAQALLILREEVARMARLRAEFAVEQEHGAPASASPRLDGMAAQLEGACRFALRMGLVAPGEARLIWQEAARAGLQDRPATGRGDLPPTTPDTHGGTQR